MKQAERIDLYKLHKDEYAATGHPQLVATGSAVYLAIEGQGEPGGDAFSAAVGALYAVAYTVKMTRKFGGEQDYGVGKLEAQWWSATPHCDFGPGGDRRRWCWKLMIRTPEFVKAAELRRAVEVLKKRGKGAETDRVRLETLKEGRCVQALHVGPYDEESVTIEKMTAFAQGKKLRLDGRHHEIYLSDPRRVPPARLKTILRHPVRPA